MNRSPRPFLRTYSSQSACPSISIPSRRKNMQCVLYSIVRQRILTPVRTRPLALYLCMSPLHRSSVTSTGAPPSRAAVLFDPRGGGRKRLLHVIRYIMSSKLERFAVH